MFIGHFAVGFAAKKVAPRVSLGWLIAAPIFLDLLWPTFLLLGVESVRIDPGNTAVTPLDLHDFPWTHSLAMSVVWSVAFAAAYRWRARRDNLGAAVLGLGVFSHWVLDVVSHRPDMPLYPGSATYWGLGLWSSVPATLAVEGALFAAGVWLYAAATRAKDRTGAWALRGFVAFLLLGYLMNVFGPPPPSPKAIAVFGHTGWLFVAWAAWIDRHRAVRPALSPVEGRSNRRVSAGR